MCIVLGSLFFVLSCSHPTNHGIIDQFSLLLTTNKEQRTKNQEQFLKPWSIETLKH